MSKRAVHKKLKSIAGFSLAEFMVTILIMSMVSALMATGVALASRQYEESMIGSESRGLCSTLSVAITDELRGATGFSAPISTATDEEGVEHYEYGSFWLAKHQMSALVTVDAKGEKLGGKKAGYLAFLGTDNNVFKLTGNSTYTRGMKARAQLDWNNAGRSDRYGPENPICTVTVTVCKNNGDTVLENVFTVMPINS